MKFRVFCAHRKETKDADLPQAPSGEVCPVCGNVNDKRFPADQQCDFQLFPISAEKSYLPEAEMPMAL